MNEPRLDLQQVLGFQFQPTTFEYTDREAILYALGVGAGRDPLDAHELSYVYEGSQKGLKILPTFAVTFPGVMAFQLLSVPGMQYNPMLLLHGEQYLELFKPLPPAGRLTNRGHIAHVYDKGSGALVIIEVTSFDPHDDPVAFNRMSVFIRGLGGFGGDRGPSSLGMNEPPPRPPDAVLEEAVPENQALLYRLAGDRNPLHADPAMAAIGGYPRPILHGLCTYGYAARQVLNRFAGGDPGRFKSLNARFARHFFPGETLVTEMWDTGDGAILFRCKARERDEYVLTNARLELKGA